jgi:hypothetical protein
MTTSTGNDGFFSLAGRALQSASFGIGGETAACGVNRARTARFRFDGAGKQAITPAALGGSQTYWKNRDRLDKTDPQ